MKKMLFITRKYPPSVGGMENGLYNMALNMPDEDLDVKIVALGKSQKHLIWFFPYILLYTLFNAAKYDYLFLGDGLICMCGVVAKWVNKKMRRLIVLHGLDVSFSNPLYQLYLRMNLKGAADVYACNSRYTENVAREWGITKNICTISHGIDMNKFFADQACGKEEFCKKYEIKENDLVLVTAGRLVKRKGVEWFIRNVLPSMENVVYLVIGNGEEKENIEKAVSETGTTSKVRLLGRISDQDLTNCYFNSDVFVMPNFHVANNAEGFGLVALEAGLCGLIVLASEVDGIPDAIKNEKNGYLLEPLNAKAYAEKIQDIQKNREEYRIVADKFRQFTIDNYSWKTTCDNMKQKLRVQ